MIECLRCPRVERVQDAAWLTTTLICEDLTDTASLCPDCQRTLHWGPRQFVNFVLRQTVAQMTVVSLGVVQ